MNFNPRPRKEGDNPLIILYASIYLFQSTPSQRWRPVILAAIQLLLQISIHALAKRATRAEVTLHQTEKISIHALAKRATP